MNKSAIIIQSRMSSTRFPGKMLKKIQGESLIDYVYKRCSMNFDGKILVATSNDPSDDVFAEHCENNSMPVFRGDLNNVLKRYIDAAKSLKVDYIIRLCGDTPLVDFSIIKKALTTLIKNDLDYVAPSRESCIPAFYAETVSVKALEQSLSKAKDKEELEHVTPYILNHQSSFKVQLDQVGLRTPEIEHLRLTVDYPQDIAVIERVLANLEDKYRFEAKDVLKAAQKDCAV